MMDWRKICRTRTSSQMHKRVYIRSIERTLIPYWELRKIFKEHAIPALQLYLNDTDDQVKAPPSPWGSNHDPFQPMDTAVFQAVTTPWKSLYISQFIDFAETRMRAGLAHPLIFTSPATEYEAWKMDKEYRDIKDAKNILHRSIQNMESRGAPIRCTCEMRQRALRLRSRGYGSGLREVVSVDEVWPHEGWASLVFSPEASYDARMEIKMRDRPFLLGNDPTDRSGIIPCSQATKISGGNW